MPDLYNFVQALNTKDTTTKDKKARATKFITNKWVIKLNLSPNHNLSDL